MLNGQYGGVSLDSYISHGSGFGSAPASDVNELNKALEATELRGGAVEGQTDASGAPLKVESLDRTLKVVTFTRKNIVIWKDFPVLPAYNTVEEYNKLTDYGSDQGAFLDEGETPESADATYVRESQLVKFMGNTRVVSHPMTLVNSAHGDVITREINNGTTWILEQIEKNLLTSDSSLNTQDWNGIYKQMQDDFSTEAEFLASDNVIDLRGGVVTETTMEDASNTVLENYGYASDIYWAPKAGSDFAKTMHPRQRAMVPVQDGTKIGAKITAFQSQAGLINLKPSVFLAPKKARYLTSGAIGAKAPAAPVADPSAPLAAVAATATGTKWVTGDAGDYFYAVAARNKYGESVLTLLSASAVTVVASGAVDLKFTAGAGTYAATYFRVYRTPKAGASTGKFLPVFDISLANVTAGYNGGATGVVRDLNLWIPGTTQAWMTQRDLEAFSFKQLAPLMKMDLALLGPAYRFMILFYGTPMVYAPRKMVRIINIGTDRTAAQTALIA